MSYEKQTENILAGSVNVLPPVDMLPPQDALRILNFRANTQGSLRTRGGFSNLQNSSTGAITSICRVDAAAPRRYFGAGGNLYRNGVSVSSGFGANTPISMVSFQGYLFATTDALQAKDDGSNFYPWQIAAPSTTATATPVTVAGATMAGDYQYFVSFYCADGSESTVAAPVLVTVTAGQGVTLSGFPAYTPPSGFANPVIGINIYRGGGTQTSVVLIAAILFSGGATSYADSLADITAQENGAVLLATNYDAPPPAYGCAGPYYDRLLLFGSTAHPNRFWWSDTQRPYAWPGVLSLDGNWVDVGELGEWILAVTVRPNMVTIYKEKSIWRIYGDPGSNNAVLERVSSTYGLVGRQAIVNIGSLDFFLNTEGVFEWNGESGKKLSPGLNPIFYGEYPDVPQNLVVPMETGSRALVAFGYRRGQLWVSYPLQGQLGTIVNNASLVYDTQTGHWVEDSRGFACFFDEGQNGSFLTGSGTQLNAIEDGIDDGGTAIAADYYSQFSNQQSPENSKIYNDLTIEINTGGSPFTAFAYLDDGATTYTLGAMQCTVRTQYVFPYGADGLGLRGKNHAVRITGTMSLGGGSSNPLNCVLYKATLHYIVQPRYSRTFDSDVTDLGMRDVKFCDFLELDIDLQGNGIGVYTWTVWSDRPRVSSGAATVARATGTFADTSVTGRRTIRLPFAEFEGQLLRVTLSADLNGQFLLYSARLRVRPIGVYLDGANSESFATKEIGLAI